jgi:hypothetical protein
MGYGIKGTYISFVYILSLILHLLSFSKKFEKFQKYFACFMPLSLCFSCFLDVKLPCLELVLESNLSWKY